MAFAPLLGAGLGGLAGGSLAAAGTGAALGGAVGGLFGGGGRQTNPATASYGGNPNVYIPTAQPQMDVQFQNLLNQQYGPAYAGANMITGLTGGVSPAAYVFPYAQTAAMNIAQNPFAAQALAGAQAGANVGGNLANMLSGADYAGLINAAQNLPALGAFEGGITTGAVPQLQSALSNILTTGYDPQSQLYNRMLNQVQQQAAAGNAAAGVTGPYAASTADQAVSNAMMNWQNQQLARQAQAAQAASGLGGQIGNLAGLSLNQVGAGLTGGLQGLGSLAGLGSNIANLETGAWGMPYATSTQQAQNAMNALSNLANIGSAGLPGYQNLIPQLQSYLNLGQTAAVNAGNLGAQGFNQNMLQQAQLGNVLGVGSNLLFGQQGLTGALGLNPQTGLLGSIFGGGGSYPTIGGPGTAPQSDVLSATNPFPGLGEGTPGTFTF